jgi:nucleotide-binding universal stress UspA family protein
MQALELLERVAAPDKSTVKVVTVNPTAKSVDSSNLAATLVDSGVARFQEAGFVADKQALEGHPAKAILAEIEEGGFGLTVLGAGNRSRLSRLLLGSVSTKILHHSPTSVLIVQKFSDLGHPVRILFGTDGSSHAELALEQMNGFLDPSSCEIQVVSVSEYLMPVISFPIPREAYVTSAPTPEQEQEWMDAANRYASDAARKLERAGFKSTARARLGAPSLRLLDELDDIPAQMVAVGAAGWGAVERAVLGSVSNQMVRYAPATLVARASVTR